MAEVNYRLVYMLRAAGLQTDSLSNLKVRHRCRAEAAAEAEHKVLTDWLTKQFDGDVNFEVTSTMCMADGVLSHVYTWKGDEPAGVGKRVCCFCGCNDFDD